MAPLAADPRQILVVLNVARRRAFYTLVFDITGYMRSDLELKPGDLEPGGSAAPLFVSSDNGRGGESPGRDAEYKRTVAPTAELIALRKAALSHFDAWRKEVMTKLKEIASLPDDNKILAARKKRQDDIAKLQRESPGEEEDLINFGDASKSGGASKSTGGSQNPQKVAALQAHYHPIPSRFTTIPVEDRKELLSCLLLLLLSMGNYSAYSRALALYLTSAFELSLDALITEETEIAKSLVESSTSAGSEGNKASMSADAEAEKRRQENQPSRYWKVGLASVAGAAVIGITGGLAAPVVAGAIGGLMGSVGLGGVASFLGIFWMNGALVGTLFGAFGAKMTGEMMDTYAKEVEDFRFLPLKDEWGEDYKKSDADAKQGRRLRVTIGINGWLTAKEDVTKPWRVLGDESEVFALRYEMQSLISLGNELEGLVSSYAWGYVKLEILKRTVLASLWAALWPAYLISAATKIDNPFNLARNRSEKAGRVLADALINRVQGERPVTLVGYSLGARVIHSCLRSLAERRAFGLIDTVVLIGAPAPSDPAHWQTLSTVVAGRICNVYSENDYILGFLYRATSLQLGIAGLQAIGGVPGVENLDLSAEVSGHLRYPDLIAKILTRCGFPNVVGGEGAIETDEDIKIKDQEVGLAEGMLIQLDDLPPEPIRPEIVRARSSTRFPEELKVAGRPDPPPQRKPNPNRTKVSRTSTATVTQEVDPLAAVVDEDPLQTKPVPQKEPAPTRHAPASAAPLPHRAPLPQTKSVPEFSGPAARLAVRQKSAPAPVTRDEDSDEEDYGGIKMVDNDEEDFSDMAMYSEPLRVEDD